MPDSKKMIVIAAPHTTNWDFIFLLGAAYRFETTAISQALLDSLGIEGAD